MGSISILSKKNPHVKISNVAVLHNQIDRKILRRQIEQSGEKWITLSFYRYMEIRDPKALRDEIYADLFRLNIRGRIYIAREGINAQISLPEKSRSAFEVWLQNKSQLKDIHLNRAIEDNGKSFIRLTVKTRKKIVADGLEEGDVDLRHVGKPLDAEAFNHLADRPDTVIVDMRNHYESEVGYFQNALRSDADTFREALPMVEKILASHRDKNIVLYCTGGIRCEKASAYYRERGFAHVHQLQGGIIGYIHQVRKQNLENKFMGKNFVFDERLGEKITDAILSQCHQCGAPCHTHVNCANDACHLLFIQCPECASRYRGTCSKSCLRVLNLPIDEQKRLRKGIKKGMQVYKKGRPSFKAAVSSQERQPFP